MTLRALLLTSLLAAACGGPKPEPTIASFKAAPAVLAEGESAELAWQTTNGDGCSIAPGIGAVSTAEGSRW